MTDETEPAEEAGKARDWTKSGLRPMPDTPGDIIKARIGLDTYLKAEMARLDTYYKPMREWLQAADNKLLELLNEAGLQNFKCEDGTAYVKTMSSPKVVDRDKFIDFVLENWDTVGNSMLQIGAPQVGTVREYVDANKGELPPGVEMTTPFRKVFVNRG